jgi:hypothetical protein
MQSVTPFQGSGIATAATLAEDDLLEGANVAKHFIPVSQVVAALGNPESPRELAQRLSVALALLWSDVAETEIFLVEGATDLQAARDTCGNHGLLATLRSEWTRMAPLGVMILRPTLIADDPAAGRGSIMAVPIFSGGGSGEGFLVIQRRSGAREFSGRDLSLLSDLAVAIGPFLPRARARANRSAAWSKVDMASARSVQRRFLPAAMDLHAGRVRVVSKYLPAFAVGGDFYDVVDLGDGRMLAAIGDVSGKGVTAALMMSRVSSELRRLASELDSPAAILTRLNREFPTWMEDDRFVTIACAKLDFSKGQWTVANAGHVFPLLRRSDGRVSQIARLSGPPIGTIAGLSYSDETFSAEAGDILLLTTDGVSEIVASDDECAELEGRSILGSSLPAAGEDALSRLVELAPHDIGEIALRIASSVERTSVERDDAAVLGLQLGD